MNAIDRPHISDDTHREVLRIMVAETTYTTAFNPKVDDNDSPLPGIVFFVILFIACGLGYIFGALI